MFQEENQVDLIFLCQVLVFFSAQYTLWVTNTMKSLASRGSIHFKLFLCQKAAFIQARLARNCEVRIVF